MIEVHPWLQVYLAAGIVTLVISAGLALRERWRRRGDPDSLISLLEPPDPRRRTLWYRVRSSVLTPVLVAIFLVLLWPAVPWMKFQDVRHARRVAREEAERVFQVHPSHLLERCSVDEAEARECEVVAVLNDALGRDAPCNSIRHFPLGPFLQEVGKVVSELRAELARFFQRRAVTLDAVEPGALGWFAGFLEDKEAGGIRRVGLEHALRQGDEGLEVAFGKEAALHLDVGVCIAEEDAVR